MWSCPSLLLNSMCSSLLWDYPELPTSTSHQVLHHLSISLKLSAIQPVQHSYQPALQPALHLYQPTTHLRSGLALLAVHLPQAPGSC